MRGTVWAVSQTGVSASLVLEKGAAEGLPGVNPGCEWASFSVFRLTKQGCLVLLSTEDSLPRKAWSSVQCSGNWYFLWENYPVFTKLHVDEQHLYQILSLFQTTYSAFIQLLPVLVIVIISVITQLLAANPPYSLFYKS